MRATVRELGEKRASGFLKKFYGWYLGRGSRGRSSKSSCSLRRSRKSRRPWLSLALLATGAGLLATARLASVSPPSPAIFRVGIEGASVQIDPQVSYVAA